MHRSKRLAGATAALAALAIAAPIAQAGAATLPATLPASWAGLTWPAFPWGTANFPTETYGAGVVARGPTVINSVFNGATVVQVVVGPASSIVTASP
jgi:hypothetical protein